MTLRHGIHEIWLVLLLLCLEPAIFSSARAGVRVLHQEPAHYPGIAGVAQLEGRVEVSVVVATTGNVTSVRVVDASHPFFRQPAKLAAWLSRFSPAVLNGVAVVDSVHLSFEFSNDPDEITLGTIWERESREQEIELVRDQVCLYGNWLSGRVQVRLSEDRVYVAGIRVHPPISDFNQELNRDFEIKQVVGEELMFECRLLERELALRGVQFDAIRLRTLEMVRNVTRFSEAGFTDDGLWVELAEGDRLEIALPDPTDGEIYFSLQPSMSSAEDAYFSWLTRLHLGVGGQFVLFAAGITQSMSLSNNMAAAIHSFLAENRASDQSGSPLIWPPEIEALSPTLREQIRRPLRVPRL